MITWISNLFKNEEQSEGLTTPKGAKVSFVLKYKDLPIGYLNHSDDKWTFVYSDEFKSQDRIDLLIDFPEKDQVYVGSYLWPFFSHRIPGLGQPQIQQTIKKENLNPNNEI